jgi:hypothetical protein
MKGLEFGAGGSSTATPTKAPAPAPARAVGVATVTHPSRGVSVWASPAIPSQPSLPAASPDTASIMGSPFPSSSNASAAAHVQASPLPFSPDEPTSNGFDFMNSPAPASAASAPLGSASELLAGLTINSSVSAHNEEASAFSFVG